MKSPFRQPSENEEDFNAMLSVSEHANQRQQQQPASSDQEIDSKMSCYCDGEVYYDTLKALYEEACAARSAATDEQTWDFLDRRCSKLAREIDDFVRGRANAIQAADREAV